MQSKMKGIDSIGAHLAHVPGLMDGWVDKKTSLDHFINYEKNVLY
jgi:hypothetical protein